MKKFNFLIILFLLISLLSFSVVGESLFAYNSSIEAGTYISGDLSATYYEDGILMIGDEADGLSPAIDFRVYFSDVENVTLVRFKYLFDEDHSSYIEAYNYSSSDWDILQLLTKESSLTKYNIAFECNESATCDYLNGGDLILRIHSHDTGTAGDYRKYFLLDLFSMEGDSSGVASTDTSTEQRNLNDGEVYEYLNYNNGLMDGFSYLGVNTIIPYSFSMSNPDFIPLVSDIDGDGSLDIIVYNNGNIIVLENKTLDLKFLIDSTITYNPQLYIYDIDGDGEQEIIVYGSFTDGIKIIKYNATSNELYFSASLGIPDYNSGDRVIACYETDRCSVFFSWSDTSNSNIYYFYQKPFNSSGYSGVSTLIYSAPATQTIGCISMLPSMEAFDIDSDDNPEYIVSFTTEGESVGGQSCVIAYRDNETGVVWDYCKNHYNTIDGNDLTCSNVIRRTISSPIVSNFDLAESGMETVVAIHGTGEENEFKVYLLDKDGAEIEDFPELYKSEGSIISNLIQCDVFDGTGDNDICIMGYQEDENYLDLFCIYPRSSWSQNSVEYGYEMGLEVTSDYSILLTGLQAVTQSPHDRSEFATPYGIFKTDGGFKNTEEGFPDNDLSLIVSFETGESVYLPVDYEGDGYIDMIALTPTALFYLDDGFSNTAPTITEEIIINPCGVDSYISPFETVSVSAVATDINNNDVSMRVQAYLGETYEIDTGFSPYYVSGSTIVESFEMVNVSGMTSLIVTVKDNYIGDSKETVYSISMLGMKINGSTYGSCVSSFSTVSEDDNPYNLTTNDLENNLIVTTLNPIGGLLGISISLVYLIFLAVLMIGGALYSHSLTNNNLIVTITAGLIGLIGLVIGVSLSLISVGIVLILVIIGLIPVALSMRKTIAGE